MSIQSILAECPAAFADRKDLFVQASSSLTLLLRAWPAWVACPEPNCHNPNWTVHPLAAGQHLVVS